MGDATKKKPLQALVHLVLSVARGGRLTKYTFEVGKYLILVPFIFSLLQVLGVCGRPSDSIKDCCQGMLRFEL